MVERRVSDRKVVDSRFDSPTGDAYLGKKLYANGPSSLPAVVNQPEETLAVEPKNGVLCWCGLTDAEYVVHTNKPAFLFCFRFFHFRSR